MLEQQIAIFGAGGFGREVLQIIHDINASEPVFSCVGFIVDSGFDINLSVGGLPILGDSSWLVAHPDVVVVVAVGSSAARCRITKQLKKSCQNKFATLIHPRAWLGRNVKVGAGSIICAGALITTDIQIAEHVHINIGSTVGHDAMLHDFVTLNPSVNVSGNVTLNEGVEIGTGSIVIPHCVIDEWSIVGAGSVVTKSIKDNCTAVGIPAKIIKERLSGWQKG